MGGISGECGECILNELLIKSLITPPDLLFDIKVKEYDTLGLLK